jgi:hypothetical protein
LKSPSSEEGVKSNQFEIGPVPLPLKSEPEREGAGSNEFEIPHHEQRRVTVPGVADPTGSC